MASSKTECSDSAVSEDCEVQMSDSTEQLITSASKSCELQVLDSNEPLIRSAPPFCAVQVLDSSEPLVTSASSSCVDSSDPLFLGASTTPALCSPSGTAGLSGIAGPSGTAGLSGTAGPSGMAGPRSSGSSSSDEEYSHESVPTRRRIAYNAEEMRSLWSWQRIYKRLGTHEQCIEFAIENGLIPREKQCSRHRRPMTLTTGAGAGLGKFRCRKSSCRNKDSVSRVTGTFLENTKLPVPVVFQILFAYSDQMSYYQICREVAEGDGPALSTATVADWYAYCQETIVVYELEHDEESNKIGGPGKVVHIEESKLDRKKYKGGRHIEGHWVITIFEEKNKDLRIAACPDSERTEQELVALIRKHVEVGSVIYTNFWGAYEPLSNHGFVHKRVNHNDPGIRPVAPDGTQRSQMKNLKTIFKRKIRHKQERNFTNWLIVYSWRRKISLRHGDPFMELIKAIRHVYPCK